MTSMRLNKTFLILLTVFLAAVGATESDAPAEKTTPASHEGHGAPAGEAKGSGAMVKGEVMTITGEVMDPACFLEAGPKSIGPGHFQCAIDCARSGQTLAIYDRAQRPHLLHRGGASGKKPE